MPRQDAQGRWISDDGLQYWDGSAWRPTGQPPVRKGVSAMPAVLIGCGFGLLVIIVLAIGGIVLVQSPDFQRSFCNSYVNGNPNQTCPFNPSP
ncbi:MAG TPA: hypothetical protein VLK30_03945 [Candidatus Limnocylindrales bacterium]|nr:hypothetical protein [Candidatus Limnocylindrales bacterium]